MKNLKLKNESGNFANEIEKVIAALKDVKVSVKQGNNDKLEENEVQEQVQQATPKTVEPTKAYRDTYLQKNDMKARHSVYIDEEDFAYYAEVVRVIDHNRIPIGGYISNILKEHRRTNKGTINEMFKQERERMYSFGD